MIRVNNGVWMNMEDQLCSSPSWARDARCKCMQDCILMFDCLVISAVIDTDCVTLSRCNG